MPNYRVDFAKEILGVPFTIGSVAIARARDPERARRLAWLIAERSPDVNAALFAAPAAACNPDLVEPRFCTLPEQVMRQLQAKGRRLDAVSADRAVWNRLAA